MLSDLDHRQTVTSNSSASNDAADPCLSIPSGLTGKPKKIPFAKISLSILIIFLLSITGYYSYLIYNIKTQSNVKASEPISKNSSIVSQPKKIIHYQAAKKKSTISTIVKQSPKTKAPVISAVVKGNGFEPISDTSVNTNQPLQSNSLETENTNLDSVNKRRLDLNPYQQSEIAYIKGYELLQNNKVYSAEAKLLLALEHNSKHIKAREMLVGLYLKSGRKIEAEDILVKGLVHLPNYPNFAKLYARLLLNLNQTSKAVKILLKHKPAIASDPNYYALLAASYQRKKNHNAAANTYVKLLKINPREGIWWVGMAISLEALNKNKEALNAYEKARQTGTLNTRISNYSSQRLKQLNLTTPTDE